MRTIGPHEQLDIGTKVKVQGKIGEVVRCQEMRAHPSGTIMVHTIRFTQKVVRGIGRETKLVPIENPFDNAVNYSFIEVLEK